MAAQHGVDLAGVTGTGVGGRIRKQDVLDAAKASSSPPRLPRPRPLRPRPAARAPVPVSPSPLRGTTEKISAGCARSSRRGWSSRCRPRPSSPRSSRSTSPTSRGCATSVKADFLAREGVKLSYLPFFAKARDRRAQAAPVAQRDDRHRGRRGHLLRPRERRVRRRHRERPADPGGQGRGRPVDRRSGQEDRRRRRSAPAPTRSVRTSCPAAPSRSPTSAASAHSSTPRSSTSRRSRSSARARSSSAPS